MNKLVYLFELDSVRSSKVEAEIGQRAIFNEVVNNGNQIALSFNQITDSKALLSLLLTTESFEQVLELSKKGVFRFSRYSDVQTPSQYVLRAIEKCLKGSNQETVFLFSAIPINCHDKAKLEVLEEAIKYSDLTRYDDVVGDAKEILFLKRFVELILTLSVQKVAINYKRDGSGKSLKDYIRKVRSIYYDNPQDFPESSILSRDLLKQSLDIIEEVLKKDEESSIEGINARSWWVELLRSYHTDMTNDLQEDAIFLSEAIIDLCYNYTVEDSIRGVSKHYQEDLEKTFENDFEQRLLSYWKQSKTLVKQDGEVATPIHQFMKVDSTEVPKYTEVESPKWDLAVRLVDNTYIEGDASDARKEYSGEAYAANEIDLEEERHKWRKRVATKVLSKICWAVFFIIVYCLVDTFMGKVEMYIPAIVHGESSSKVLLFIQEVLETGIQIIFFGIIASILSNVFNIPDVLDSVIGIGKNLKDIYHIRKIRNNKSYESYEGVVDNEE